MNRFEYVVYDGIDPCVYLKGERSRTPFRWQSQNLHPEEVDIVLSLGDRRYGEHLYRTDCPSCHACEPLRIPVQSFRRSKSQRKIWNRNQDIRVEIKPIQYTSEKLRLFNRHKLERGLAKNSRSESDYCNWFVDSCVNTIEFLYYIENKLICVSILDKGELDYSSVYVYFDPDYGRRSLGTFSALYELEWMRTQKLRYYYLGFYVKDCTRLNYKSQYYPHDRLFEGVWHRFADSSVTKFSSQRIAHHESPLS